MRFWQRRFRQPRAGFVVITKPLLPGLACLPLRSMTNPKATLQFMATAMRHTERPSEIWRFSGGVVVTNFKKKTYNEPAGPKGTGLGAQI